MSHTSNSLNSKASHRWSYLGAKHCKNRLRNKHAHLLPTLNKASTNVWPLNHQTSPVTTSWVPRWSNRKTTSSVSKFSKMQTRQWAILYICQATTLQRSTNKIGFWKWHIQQLERCIFSSCGMQRICMLLTRAPRSQPVHSQGVQT